MSESAPPIGPGASAKEVSIARFMTRPNDLDSLGHMNNAVVLEYLEAGRWDWFVRNGLQRAGRVTPVVARAEVDYRQEIFPGELTISTRVTTDISELVYRATFHQTIMALQNGKEQLAVEARIYTAFLDMPTRELRSFQDFLEANAIPRGQDSTVTR
jgi:acyl-CoA thioester hydrolase